MIFLPPLLFPVQFAKEGNLQEATRHFLAASLEVGHRGDVWANVGLSLRQQVESFSATDRKNATAKGMLRDALAAFDLAVFLANQPAGSMRSE